MVIGGAGNNVSNDVKESIKKMIASTEKEEQQNLKQSQLKIVDPMAITDDYDDMAEKFGKLQGMYKQICLDVRDQENENTKEKMDILETLRYQEKELDFLR